MAACSKNNTAPIPAIPAGSETGIISNIVYATNTNYLGENQQLELDIYLPTNNSILSKSPLVLFIHGVGFLEGDKKTAKNDC